MLITCFEGGQSSSWAANADHIMVLVPMGYTISFRSLTILVVDYDWLWMILRYHRDEG